MSYDVNVKHVADSGDGISVEARINGEMVSHTFPKGMGFMERNIDGNPRYVEELVEIYKDRFEKVGSQTVEDKIVENKVHENKTFSIGDKGETFKHEKNQIKDMTNVDTSNPEEIRAYLKENMAEGYLSEEEGLNIDKFVDEYIELRDLKQGFEEIIREVYEGQVQ